MDRHRFTTVTGSVSHVPSRRDVLHCLTSVGIRLASLRLPHAAEAKHKHHKKGKKHKHTSPQPTPPPPSPPLCLPLRPISKRVSTPRARERI